MTYPLDILIQDREQNPRSGVLVEIEFPDETTKHKRSGTDGVAHFDVPAIEAITVKVCGMIRSHSTRGAGGRVWRIEVVCRP